MKKMKKQMLMVLMAVMVTFTMAPNTAEAAAKKSVTVSVSTKKLAPKKSAQLKVKYGKKNVTKKAKYKTSNKKVLTVNKKGRITAKKAGKATVTVRYGKKTKRVAFTVGKAAPKKAGTAVKKTAGSKGSGGSHVHQWVKKTKTEKKWVPKMVTVEDYETVNTCIWHCVCGAEMPATETVMGDHAVNHILADEPSNGYVEVVEEKRLIGTHQEDRGHYEDVPCGTYYQCACGATK